MHWHAIAGKKGEAHMSLYVFGQLTSWVVNIIYIVALVVIIKLAIKATEALDIYINDKKNNRS